MKISHGILAILVMAMIAVCAPMAMPQTATMFLDDDLTNGTDQACIQAVVTIHRFFVENPGVDRIVFENTNWIPVPSPLSFEEFVVRYKSDLGQYCAHQKPRTRR